MRLGLRLPWQERWGPHELGYSLPIAQSLQRWAGGLAVLAVAALVGLIFLLRDLGQPAEAPASESMVRSHATRTLARVSLRPWDPGDQLPRVDPPGFLPAPEPPLSHAHHPSDPPLRDPDMVERALRQIERGEALVGAATRLSQAADAQPDSWLLAYNSGVAFLRTGFDDRAQEALRRAQQHLDDLSSRYRGNFRHYAFVVLNRYALARALERDDCVDAIWHLKLAVNDLGTYVDVGEAEVFDRTLPFSLTGTSLSNLDVWTALNSAYLHCDDYPGKYFRRRPNAQRFRQGEYDNPQAAQVREGPFFRELSACIENDGATAHCWVVSNLNRLIAANRPLLERPELPGDFELHRGALARLALNTSLLAATGEDKEGAVTYLEQGARLARGAQEQAGQIDALGRYLAAEVQNYSALALPYRNRSAPEMPFADDPSPEAVKGMAWALRERWQGFLGREQPGEIFKEVEEARQMIPGAFLASLDDWEVAARAALEKALAEEIRLQKRRGNQALAAGLRDFRPGYVGPGWPERANDAWWTPGLRITWWSLIVLYLSFLATLVLFYRRVVYPYLMYTADYYKSEFERRREERRAKNLPLTGRDIFERRQSRRVEEV